MLHYTFVVRQLQSELLNSDVLQESLSCHCNGRERMCTLTVKSYVIVVSLKPNNPNQTENYQTKKTES